MSGKWWHCLAVRAAPCLQNGQKGCALPAPSQRVFTRSLLCLLSLRVLLQLSLARTRGVPRFLQNPEGWGPKSRHGKAAKKQRVEQTQHPNQGEAQAQAEVAPRAQQMQQQEDGGEEVEGVKVEGEPAIEGEFSGEPGPKEGQASAAEAEAEAEAEAGQLQH